MRAVVVVMLAACSSAAPTPARPLAPPPPSGPPPVVEWSALVGEIQSITIMTPDQMLAPQAKELLADEVGKPIERVRLRGELAKVLALRGVADVSASARQLEHGVELIVDVVPQPLLHALTAHEVGGKDITLPGQLASATGLPVDPKLFDAIAEHLRVDYLGRGFVEVAADWHQVVQPGGVDVTFEVTPGAQSTVTKVEFRGNAHGKRADLVKAIGQDPANVPWDAEWMERAALLVTSYYYDHGFVNVAVVSPKPAGGASTAVFTITEGDLFKVGKVEVTGVSPADTKQYLALLGTKKGDIFNRSTIAAGVQKVEDAVRAGGAARASVAPLTKIDTAKKLIDLTFEITK